MATNRMVTSTPPSVERRRLTVSGLAVRILIALAISWLIIMAFFVSSVASH